MAGLPLATTGSEPTRLAPKTDKRAPCSMLSCAGIKLVGKDEPGRKPAGVPAGFVPGKVDAFSTADLCKYG